MSDESTGKSLDLLVHHLSQANAHAQVLRAAGLSVQMHVNGHDYGDQVSLRLEGELVTAPPADLGNFPDKSR
jgi:hypothetical protein